MAATQKGRRAAALPSGPHLMPCDVLVGEIAVDRDGEALGELAHLVIDMANGRVTHVVIARGGVLGLGEKLHAIPWSAVTLDVHRRLVVDIARERMERAPGFDRSRWPSMRDPAWQRDLEGFYSRGHAEGIRRA